MWYSGAMIRKRRATAVLFFTLLAGTALTFGQAGNPAQARSLDALPWQEQVAWGAQLALAAAGLAGIVLAMLLLRKIERQTRAAETSATAAADAAQAAQAQAQALLHLDRPWVLISTEPSRTLENSFAVVATNRGRSPARIVSSVDAACIAASEEQLPHEPEFRRAPGGGSFEPVTLLPGESFLVLTFGREEMKQVCREDGSLERVDTWKDRIYLYGRLRYRDLRAVGDQMEHETRWCCWYVNGRQHSGLVVAGPPSYNCHS